MASSDAIPEEARKCVENAPPRPSSVLHENYDLVDETKLDDPQVKQWAKHANQAQRAVTAAARLADAAQRFAAVCAGYAFESAASGSLVHGSKHGI